LTNWRIEIKPTAEKQYLRLDKQTRRRIKKALIEIENASSPFTHPRVKALTGKLKGDYRIRIGGWRALFVPDKDRRILFVFAILPRGDAY